MKRIIHPDPHCEFCHGSGIVTDWVDYGSTHVPMTTDCDCVLEQVEEGDEWEVVPAEGQQEAQPEPPAVYVTPPHVVDFVMGSGALLSVNRLQIDSIIGNPPYEAGEGQEEP